MLEVLEESKISNH